MKIRLIAQAALLTAALAMSGLQSFAKDAQLSPNAPEDRPVAINTKEQLKKHDELIAPCIKKARKTLPQAKARFLKGLPSGQIFFLTTRLHDSKGNVEQVFVRVRSWEKDQIKGSLSNQVRLNLPYKQGDTITFNEKDVYDWLIAKPDGSEEGNFIGKFMDSMRK